MSEFSKTHDVQEGEFKGHSTLQIPISEGRDGEVFYMSMGLKKAQRILEYFEEIESWVIRMEKK